MWVYVFDEPIPTYGAGDKIFMLRLHYHDYYGHNIAKEDEVVTAKWDIVNECFYETKTQKEIYNRDIVEWWKEV